jgi:hypothetical protein
MLMEQDTLLYHSLQRELVRLHRQPVRDWAAIESVMRRLDEEQRQLKSHDGQHGNNPIEWRHRDPPDDHG